MAKRKRGGRKGFSLKLETDYRSERFTMYIANAETGILQASKVAPELTDGDVSQALTDLIAELQDPARAEALLTPGTETPEDEGEGEQEKDQLGIVPHFILMNLYSAFDRYGPLPAEDVIGILDVIKTSVKRWGHGTHRRGYLTYIEDFLGQMGVETRLLTPEEVENMEFYRAEPPGLSEGREDDES